MVSEKSRSSKMASWDADGSRKDPFRRKISRGAADDDRSIELVQEWVSIGVGEEDLIGWWNARGIDGGGGENPLVS